jgi:SAM-dependent methyltransferase
MGKRKKRKKEKAKVTAKSADRHRLYEKSVQAADFEVELLTKHFKRRVGRIPLSLREDFCGTALLCTEWVESDPRRIATGIDIDSSVLTWGRNHNIARLDGAASRVRLVQGDVRDGDDAKHDLIVAFNYSYFCFKDRSTLRRYFESVKKNLAPDGLFIIDLFGGYEAVQVMEEPRRYRHFTYVWDQAVFNPITHDFKAHIHFRFKDGTALEKAFTYDWRMWTIPELRELLTEAGFHQIECLWEDEDEDGEGTGEFRPRKKVICDPGYNAYLVASLIDAPLPEKNKKRKKKEVADRVAG